MNRTEKRQYARLVHAAAGNTVRDASTANRTPSDWPPDVPYPSRATRRALQFGKPDPVEPPEGRSNRSDARPAKHERARRVRARRRAERIARREAR